MATKNTNKQSKAEQAKGVVLPTLPQDEMPLAVQVEQGAFALTAIATALDCRRIVDAESAIAVYKGADGMAECLTTIRAKALWRAKQLRVNPDNDNPKGVPVWKAERLESFEKWADKHFGVSNSQAQNYVKAAPYINDNGFGTPYDRDGYRYTVAQLVAVIEWKGAKNADAIREALSGKVHPRMSVSEIKELRRELPDGTITDTTSENAPTQSDTPDTDKDTATPTAGAQTAKDAPKQPERVARVKNTDNASEIAFDMPVPAGATITITYGGKVYTFTAKLAE